MSRLVLTFVLAAAIAPIASAEERLPHRNFEAGSETLTPAGPVTLHQMFADVAPAGSELREDGTILANGPALDVIVARIASDGTTETVCLRDEKSANEFLSGTSRSSADVRREK